MSNNLVGTIYQQIINEVIEASRVDFEDQGVGEDVLDELRMGWQLKLSRLQVASFPWDPPPPAPAPAPAPAAQHAPAAPAAPAHQAQPVQQAQQQHHPQQQVGTPSYTSATLSPQPAPNAQPPPLANGLPGPPQNYNGQQVNHQEAMKQESVVKQEPGLANAGMPPSHPGNMSQYPGVQGGAGGVAAQRAAAQLQNQYGSRAAASISAIHGYNQGGQPQGQQMPPRPGAPPNQPGQAQRPQQTPTQAQQAQQVQYNQQVANQVAAMAQQRGVAPPPHTGPQNGFQQSQTDGAADGYEGVLMRQNENGETSELGRVDIDRLLHKEMAARAKQMEGGGLMLPLKEATKHKSTLNAKSSSDAGPSKFDGVDDEIKREEEDEDAINSDLDDPDEVDIADEDDEENMGHIMLCMYDKVQRVKNKWKCTLKDGVLNVNGKDYVFHKATGEYEW